MPVLLARSVSAARQRELFVRFGITSVQDTIAGRLSTGYFPKDMKPYYTDSACTIYHGDCRGVLPDISGISCAVTSPPYNQKIDQFKASGFKAEGNAQWAKRISSSYGDSIDESEYRRIQVEVLDLIFESSVENASCFYNHKCRWRDGELLHPIDIVRDSRWNIRQEIIWARHGSLTQNARMFPPSEERIYWLRKGDFRWNEDANRWMSVWRLDSAKMTQHPVCFPSQIPERAIFATTGEGQLVLDPFMGSGTTLRAAKDLGRKAIGIEIEERYCEIAAQRLSQEVLQFG